MSKQGVSFGKDVDELLAKHRGTGISMSEVIGVLTMTIHILMHEDDEEDRDPADWWKEIL